MCQINIPVYRYVALPLNEIVKKANESEILDVSTRRRATRLDVQPE